MGGEGRENVKLLQDAVKHYNSNAKLCLKYLTPRKALFSDNGFIFTSIVLKRYIINILVPLFLFFKYFRTNNSLFVK